MNDEAGRIIKKAVPILQDAVNSDNAGKMAVAVSQYRKGAEMLAQAMRLMSIADKRKSTIRERFVTYVKKIAQLEYETKIDVEIEQRRITSDSTGHGYDQIFTKCCDDRLKMVHIQDAYIVAHHQLLNFVRFCELVVQTARNLLVITLKTGEDAKSNLAAFSELSGSLEKRGVVLHVEFSKSLHDREIRFDNGWMVKSGRGLDYFKPPEGKYSLGACDFNLRPCHETIIDTFRPKNYFRK